MGTYRPCVSCGQQCNVWARSAPGGPLCRACRQRLCLFCGKAFSADKRNSAFCSALCMHAFHVALLAGTEAS